MNRITHNGSRRHPSYARLDYEHGHGLRLALSGFVIGLCLGAGLLYVGHDLPLARYAETLEHKLVQANNAIIAMPKPQPTVCPSLMPLQNQLKQCEDQVNQLKAERVQKQDEEKATANVIVTATPAPSVIANPPWPRDWPKPPAIKPTYTAPTRPPIQSPPSTSDQKIEDSEAPSPELENTQGNAGIERAESFRLSVGQEHLASGNVRLRLVAVSQRTTGRYCIIAGDRFPALRIASGQSARVNATTPAFSITASVQDGDTCQFNLRPL